MEEFQRMVSLCCDPSASSGIRAEAIQWCEEFKASEEGWMYCAFNLINNEYPDEQIQLACYEVVEYAIKSRYEGFNSEQKALVKHLCTTLLQGHFQYPETTPVFYKTKLAIVFVQVFIHEFPHDWPSFFFDVLGIQNPSEEITQFNPAALEFFLRVLHIIDEEIVDRQFSRDTRELARNSSLKDAMRIHCLPFVGEIWLHIFSLADNNVGQELVNLCLSVMDHYISWVDIDLVVNPRVIPYLFRFLQEPSPLQANACRCFVAILEKGMEANQRLLIIKNIGIIEAITGMIDTITLDDADAIEDIEFVITLSELVFNIGDCVMTILQKELVLSRSEAYPCLFPLLPLIFKLYKCEDDDVSETVVPFIQSFLQLLKQRSLELYEGASQDVETIVHLTMHKMRYGDDYNFDDPAEDEDMFENFRKLLKTVLDSVALLDANLMLHTVQNHVASVVGARLEAASAGLEPSFQDSMDVELVFRLVYDLHDSFKLMLDTENSPLASIVQDLLCSRIHHFYTHRAVTSMYFEVIVRYARFLVEWGQDGAALTESIKDFLSPLGLNHPLPSVRSRSTYLFLRFIKMVRPQIMPYTKILFEQLIPLLLSELSGNKLYTFDEQYFLYEAIGTLLVSLDAADGSSIMAQLIEPLIARFNDIISKELPMAVDMRTRTELVDYIKHLMTCMTFLSKGFPSLNALQGAGCAEGFTTLVQEFVKAPKNVPFQRATVNSGLRTFLHRMLVCLGNELLPLIPHVIYELIDPSRCELQDLRETIPLINQVMFTFKLGAYSFLEALFPHIMGVFNACLTAEIDPSDTNAQAELLDLEKIMFTFVNAVLQMELGPVLVQENHLPFFLPLVELIIQVGSNIDDATTIKTCFSLIRRFVALFFGSNGGEFDRLITEVAIPACFGVPLRPDFNIDDGQTWAALLEICSTQIGLYEKLGDDYIQFLQVTMLPHLSWDPERIYSYTQVLSQRNTSSLGNFFKALLRGLRRSESQSAS